jgi:hypothetical protein
MLQTAIAAAQCHPIRRQQLFMRSGNASNEIGPLVRKQLLLKSASEPRHS